MSDQLSLVGGPLEEKFLAFDVANPHVYSVLIRLARQWQDRRPGQRVGIGMLFERMRWEIAMHTEGDDYRLNNSYRAFYARKLETEHPEFEGLFETRRSVADQTFAVAA